MTRPWEESGKSMIRLTESQINDKIQFIEDYTESSNPASGSKLDPNANITKKSITTLMNELNKDVYVQVNRKLISDIISEEFDSRLAEQYIEDIESHDIYVHDETSLMPYCVSISMYPFLLSGMKGLGNLSGSDAPKHLRSFCGSFVNLVQYIASQFAGAVATVEFLMYFDYFARKDYGDNYLSEREDLIDQELQGIVYLLNQDSAARGGQSVFWNISTFDKPFFEGIFGEFVFPDMTKPNWSTLNSLQIHFHRWFRKEREKKLLTFPVVTHAAIINGDDWVDEPNADWVAQEMSKGGEFFIYTSDSADSLASCCRLKNELQDNTFSYSLGAGGVSTGSKNVITLNVNRIYQTGGSDKLNSVISRVHMYQVAYDKFLRSLKGKGFLPVYDAHYIELDKQYLTLGLNGIVETAEYLGIDPNPNNDDYIAFLTDLVSNLKKKNKEASKKYNLLFNTELVPAENLGVKNAKWDREDGLIVERDCYNSYFYRTEDYDIDLFDKMKLHGGSIVANLDGGSALHWNHGFRLTSVQYRFILKQLAVNGCNYFCENVRKTACNECGYIHHNTTGRCVKCGSDDIKYATRVIGYLKFIENFSYDRQKEENRRSYANNVIKDD